MPRTFLVMDFEQKPVLIVFPPTRRIENERVCGHGAMHTEVYVVHLRCTSLLLALDRGFDAAIRQLKPSVPSQLREESAAGGLLRTPLETRPRLSTI